MKQPKTIKSPTIGGLISLLATTSAFLPHLTPVYHRTTLLSPSSLSSSPNPSSSDDNKPTGTISKQQQIYEEADGALSRVGWSTPTPLEGEGAMTSDDPFVKRIDAQIRDDMGVGLDELLNPAKVVNLERDLFNLRTELASVTGVPNVGSLNVLEMSTEECDGGGGGEVAVALRSKIEKKEKDLLIERRSVFRGWLKNIFLGQAVLSFVLSWFMATNPGLIFGGFDWFDKYALDTPIRVLGFWWWWLFIVPSLRSRRPSGPEKKALDIAFLGTPAISLLAPAATKDTAIIWFANFAVVAASYGYAFFLDGGDGGDTKEEKDQPEWVKFVYKSLDFGTGRERGARK